MALGYNCSLIKNLLLLGQATPPLQSPVARELRPLSSQQLIVIIEHFTNVLQLYIIYSH
jgi:hypothetical protein